MKVLIIGATGLLGRPIVKQFKESGYKLRLFSRSIKKSDLTTENEYYEGDVLSKKDVSNALKGCDAVHISVAQVDEALAVEVVVDEAKKQNIKMISYVSGASVCEENSWFWFVENKLRAENLIKTSGISYFIYKPTWFFESLKLMIRNNKASVIGKQPSSHWLAAKDFANLVVNSYSYDEKNETLYVFGPEKRGMKELLGLYCQKVYPQIKKVSYTPIFILRFIAKLSGNKEIKMAADMFSYFEKIGELEPKVNGIKEQDIPKTNFEDWLSQDKVSCV